MNPFYFQLLSNIMLITLVLNLFITTVLAFVPISRYYQGSVIIRDKIYFLGGIGVSGKGSNELFYLDVSSPFTTVNLKWTDLTTIAPIPVSSAFAPSCVGGSNNATIFLLEHRSANNVNSTNLVTFTFDTTTQKWSIPTTTIPPPTRQDMKAVVDNYGRIYISGGYEPYATLKSYNNTYVLDSLSLSWLSGSNAPITRSGYTATLLPSGQIVYIGGTNEDPTPEIDMKQISIYNTISGTWSLMTAGGEAIAARQSHTAVLAAGIGGTLVGIMIAGFVGFICYRKYRKNPDNDPYIPTPGSTSVREYDDPVDYVPTPGSNIRETRHSVFTPPSTTNRYGTPSFVSNTSSAYDSPNYMYQSGAPDVTFIPPGTPIPGTYNQGVLIQGPIHGVYNQGA
ncbi:12693_t:CDS:2 [Cetraspora pellucida]|uniref:12693_t:CDS:1 n=1 Tax=Cetraspora pellucida TaxID=1433469 RepID=A0A9N8VG58_9GLOM|nr:12693_t:CDS:2 [Cetraspora pellucida]